MAPDVLVDGLTKRYGDVTALDGVSFEVAPGELFGLIGPDGAGKTTLLRILATLLVADAGSAGVLGHDVVDGMWELRRRIGYMPGRFSLYPDLSVAENLAFFASVFGTSVDEEYERIAPVYRQIEPFADRRAEALSGGMKQKLALSCALVHRPDILLLDEPTTGVDAVSRREFWDMLQALRDDGLTILVSTPYMDEAGRCERAALVDEGRILGIDAPHALGREFGRPLLAVRFARDAEATPTDPARGPSARERARLLGVLRALPEAASVHPFGESVHYADRRRDADPSALSREVEAALHAAGFGDITVGSIEPGIEDVFMARMGRTP